MYLTIQGFSYALGQLVQHEWLFHDVECVIGPAVAFKDIGGISRHEQNLQIGPRGTGLQGKIWTRGAAGQYDICQQNIDALIGFPLICAAVPSLASITW